ncbi:MAG TPA: hypothetical protein DDX01_04830 [Holosporales bacterium]|nr:hypothetical protein [Holosporales bacterium]
MDHQFPSKVVEVEVVQIKAVVVEAVVQIINLYQVVAEEVVEAPEESPLPPLSPFPLVCL